MSSIQANWMWLELAIEGAVGHLQPLYLCLSRLGCSLGEVQDVRPVRLYQDLMKIRALCSVLS